MENLRQHRFEFIFVALVILLMTPLTAAILNVDVSYVNLFSLSLLSFSGLLLTEEKVSRGLSVTLSVTTFILVWAEFLQLNMPHLSLMRMWSMLFMYLILSFVLIRSFIAEEEVELSVIAGAIAAFILIGVIGGTLFELLDHYEQGSILLTQDAGGYDFYYYSFISLMTVGYGDIVPLSGAAKSLTILIGLTGQLYLTIAIAIFVGKHLNSKPKTT